MQALFPKVEDDPPVAEQSVDREMKSSPGRVSGIIQITVAFQFRKDIFKNF